MGQVQINLRVSVEELAVVDRLRGSMPRNTWVRKVIREAEGAGASQQGAPVSGPPVDRVVSTLAGLEPRRRRRVLGQVGANGALPPAGGYAQRGAA